MVKKYTHNKACEDPYDVHSRSIIFIYLHECVILP